MAYHGPEDNLCHYMTFRLKIFKVGKFPTSWSLTKLKDFGTHAELAIRGSTFLLVPMKTDDSISIDFREKQKTLFPLSLSLFSSLTLLTACLCAKNGPFFLFDFS